MAAQPARQESFNDKKEVDEAQQAPHLLGNTGLTFNPDEKQEDLDVGAQVCL